MDIYDTDKMRSCAQDIEEQLTKYNSALSELEDLVTNLKNNWKDSTNEEYSRKFMNDALPSAESVAKLMKAFADFLVECATKYEKIHVDGNDAING